MEQTEDRKLTGLLLLREPFKPHQISKLPKPTKRQTEELRANFKLGARCSLCGGWHQPEVIHLDYVGHAALTDRLLDADINWTWEPLSMSPDGLPVMDNLGGMWIKLTVCGQTRIGYGHAGEKTGGDAIKEIIGDALRNAAMRFGAALDLWHKGDLHGGEDEETKDEKKRKEPPLTKGPIVATNTTMPQASVADWLSAIETASLDELDGVVKAGLDAATILRDRDAYAVIRRAGQARKDRG